MTLRESLEKFYPGWYCMNNAPLKKLDHTVVVIKDGGYNEGQRAHEHIVELDHKGRTSQVIIRMCGKGPKLLPFKKNWKED